MHLMINMHLTTTVTKDVGLNGTLNENAFAFYDTKLFRDTYKCKFIFAHFRFIS